jgi:predicted acyltransferase
MKYELVKKSTIYTFIVVTVSMTLLGILAVWDLIGDDALWRAFTTILVVGLGCVTSAYAFSLLEGEPQQIEALPSFAPHPKPVPPAPDHIA